MSAYPDYTRSSSEPEANSLIIWLVVLGLVLLVIGAFGLSKGQTEESRNAQLEVIQTTEEQNIKLRCDRIAMVRSFNDLPVLCVKYYK